MEMNKLFSLENKTALITGGASGIGQAIAKGFAKAGADVIIIYNHSGPEETERLVTKENRKFSAIKADLAKVDDTLAIMEKAIELSGTVDILVNGAGMGYECPSEECDLAKWDETIMVNQTAPYILSSHFGKHIIDRKGSGKIINISSVVFQNAIPDIISYNVTKTALLSITKTMANEWGEHNIHVNTIAPGIVLTKMTANVKKDPVAYAKHINRSALKRIAEPDELIGPAVFLASEASSYVTGSLLVVDGGSTLN